MYEDDQNLGNGGGAGDGSGQPTGTPPPAGNAWNQDEENAARQYFQQFIADKKIPGDWGNIDDLMRGYQAARQQGKSHDDAMNGAPVALGWDKYAAPGPPPPPPPPGVKGPPPPPSAGDGSLSSIFQPPAERFNVGGWDAAMPTFHAPDFHPGAAFVEPDYNAALKDPGYQFEANEGRRMMEQGAAAKGVLNGGGTLKDVNTWGQNFATQRVNDVRNRAKDNYLLNYQTQTIDPYKYAYQSALDAFTGSMSGWQTRGQVGQRQNEIDWTHAYTPFNDLWNRQIQVGLS